MDLLEISLFQGRLEVPQWNYYGCLHNHCPNVVLEANFRYRSDYERTRISALQGILTEVYCECPAEEVLRRYSKRAESPRHHPAHTLPSITLKFLEQFDQPVGSGTVIKVATDRPVTMTELVSRIKETWGKPNNQTGSGDVG